MAGIYIHIPFCKTRCIYCDFYSTTQLSLKEQYIEALCKELDMRKEYPVEPIRTIYFGGGTPSQLMPDDFQKIFDCIHLYYNAENVEEITLEANPDDLTPEYLQQLSTLPFNRISIGIQTFDDQLLKLLKRRHTASQAIEAVKNARAAGFKNINIDLIYGLPEETAENWTSDLAQAIALRVEHISAYHLTYEKGTALHNMLQREDIKEVSEENSLAFFTILTSQLSKAGYEHYEISNFCLPGKYSLHNSSYWKGIKYMGVGPSAHSYNGKSREWNVSSLQSYIKGIESGIRKHEMEMLDMTTMYNDWVVTAIRTVWGLSLSMLEEEFGKEYLGHVLRNAQKYLDNQQLEIQNNHLRLTTKGIFISDTIMSDLLRIDE